MKTTVSVRKEQYEKGGEFTREWYCIDAEGQTLGRIATKIASLLRGKGKPHFTKNVDTGDFVIIVNAEKIHLTGKKLQDKMYHHHTGYPGGLKSVSAGDLLKKKPTDLIKHAVKGMMPKNQLSRDALRKLKVYSGPEHPHSAQNPKQLDI